MFAGRAGQQNRVALAVYRIAADGGCVVVQQIGRARMIRRRDPIFRFLVIVCTQPLSVGVPVRAGNRHSAAAVGRRSSTAQKSFQTVVALDQIAVIVGGATCRCGGDCGCSGGGGIESANAGRSYRRGGRVVVARQTARTETIHVALCGRMWTVTVDHLHFDQRLLCARTEVNVSRDRRSVEFISLCPSMRRTGHRRTHVALTNTCISVSGVLLRSRMRSI